MKTKEELCAIKNGSAALHAKYAELSGEEMIQVTGGTDIEETGFLNNPFPDLNEACTGTDRFTFYFLATEHYDQIVPENLFRILNPENPQ